jgi:MFS family permease
MKPSAIQRRIQVVAVGGMALFLLIVIVEHLASPSLNPATHEISEYVHTSLGWLMTIGFVGWAVSLAATGVWADSGSVGRPLCIALLLSAIGIGVAACFATQTSAGQLPHGVSLRASGWLHDIGSGLATLALIAAALLSLRIRERPTLTRVTMALLAFALPADIVLLALGSSVAGIRQRLLVVIGCAWQLGLLKLDAGHAKRVLGRGW